MNVTVVQRNVCRVASALTQIKVVHAVCHQDVIQHLEILISVAGEKLLSSVCSGNILVCKKERDQDKNENSHYSFNSVWGRGGGERKGRGDEKRERWGMGSRGRGRAKTEFEKENFQPVEQLLSNYAVKVTKRGTLKSLRNV